MNEEVLHCSCSSCLPLLAMAAESPEDIKIDIERHRAMAAAHEAAAKCLESGEKVRPMPERAAGRMQGLGYRKILRAEARTLTCTSRRKP